jgi:hypothetical protein
MARIKIKRELKQLCTPNKEMVMSSLRFFDFLPKTTRSIADQVPPLASESYYLYRENLTNQERLKNSTRDSFKQMLVLCFKAGNEYFKKVFDSKKTVLSSKPQILMTFDQLTRSSSGLTNTNPLINTRPSISIIK